MWALVWQGGANKSFETQIYSLLLVPSGEGREWEQVLNEFSVKPKSALKTRQYVPRKRDSRCHSAQGYGVRITESLSIRVSGF